MSLIEKEKTIDFILTDMRRMSWNQARNDAINGFVKRMRKFPEVDAVPVARCRDCKYVIDREDGSHGCYRNFIDDCQFEDFCSYGEMSMTMKA